MRISAILCATTLAAASAGLAHAGAVNFIQNGNFASTNPTKTVSTQFGSSYSAGNFISNWTGNNGYEIWYPSATAATTEDAVGQYTYTNAEHLWAATAPPNGSPTFVGLDGDHSNGVASSISQMLTGLTVGENYTVSFNWAGAQMASRTGATTDMLAVSLSSGLMNNLNYSYGTSPAGGCGSNGNWQLTCALSNASEGFTGWKWDSMTFTAKSSTEWLNFLSVGSPSSLPPMALLTNVSLVQAPEPGALALLGGGLLALGFALIQRRRAARDRA